MLYQSNLTEQMQYRYIEYKYELEDRFPNMCVGMADDPGSCDMGDENNGNEPSNEGMVHPHRMATTGNPTNTDCGGCSSGGRNRFEAWLLGLWGIRRRSKSRH